MQKNLERMLKLAETSFDVRNDQEQLDVDQSVIEKLLKIHPATVSEKSTEDGPVAWLLIFPTTKILMHRFLNKEISEKELFYLTSVGENYSAIYLCSAMVLEEFRRQGITKELTKKAIEDIRNDHPISSLFVWTFSHEGNNASEAIADLENLPLYKRNA